MRNVIGACGHNTGIPFVRVRGCRGDEATGRKDARREKNCPRADQQSTRAPLATHPSTVQALEKAHSRVFRMRYLYTFPGQPCILMHIKHLRSGAAEPAIHPSNHAEVRTGKSSLGNDRSRWVPGHAETALVADLDWAGREYHPRRSTGRFEEAGVCRDLARLALGARPSVSVHDGLTMHA